jgi:hypothetical protein
MGFKDDVYPPRLQYRSTEPRGRSGSASGAECVPPSRKGSDGLDRKESPVSSSSGGVGFGWWESEGIRG